MEPADQEDQANQASSAGAADPAAWRADPFGRHELRYWDGSAWTAHVSDAGVQGSDEPVANDPSSPPPAPPGPVEPAAASGKGSWKDKLKNAPGFDKNNWPKTADRKWGEDIHRYYGYEPYWSSATAGSTPRR